MNETEERCIYKGYHFQNNVDFESSNIKIISQIICILGGVISPSIVVGNGLVIVALLRKESLRTPTNILICILALSDCFTGMFFIPLFMAYLSSLENFQSCSLLGAVFANGWICCGSSFLAMLAVSIERYLALFLHLKYESFATVRKAIFSGVVSWLIPILAALLYVLGYFAVSIIASVIFLLPGLMTIAFIYLKIFRLVRRHSLQIHSHEHSGNIAHTTRQRKLAVTMALVVGVSFLCYLPIVFGIIVAMAINFTVASKEALGFCSFLFTISSFCNPFIYCHRNQEIRNAVVTCLQDLKRWTLGTSSGFTEASHHRDHNSRLPNPSSVKRVT